MDATVRAGLVDVVVALRSSAPGAGLADAQLYDRALRILGVGPVAWATRSAADATALVIELNPEDLLIPVQHIGIANETLLLEILLDLVGAPPAASTIDRTRAETVRDTAARDVPILRVINSLRAVQQFWTQLLLDHATAIGAGPSVFGAIAGGLAAKIDRSADRLLRDHLSERERLINGVAEQRRKTVSALVAGEPVDRALVHDRLAIDLDHHHVAVVLTAMTGGLSATEDLGQCYYRSNMRLATQLRRCTCTATRSSSGCGESRRWWATP